MLPRNRLLKCIQHLVGVAKSRDLEGCARKFCGIRGRLGAAFPLFFIYSASAFAQNSAPCAAPPPPVLIVTGTQFYTDQKSSVPDATLMARFVKEQQPLREFERAVGDMTDAALMFPVGDKNSAECAIRWLSSWAGADALRTIEPNGSVQRALAVASLSFSALKLFGVQPICDVRRDEVVGWLRKTLTSVKENEESVRPPGSENNVSYWAALGAVNLGILSGDTDLTAWGVSIFRRALNSLTPDGFLPRDMQRGQRALTYELFGATPLMTIRILAEKDHIANLEKQDPELEKLFAALGRAINEPEWFDSIAGVKQERLDIGQTYAANLGLALYECRFAGPLDRTGMSYLPKHADYFLGTALPYLKCPESLPFKLPRMCPSGSR